MVAPTISVLRSISRRSSSRCTNCASLLPDLIEYRQWDKDPNVIEAKIPVIETFRGKATDAMLLGLPCPRVPDVQFLLPQGLRGWVAGCLYAVWLLVVATLYPLCRWVVAVKGRRQDWWLSYL